MSVLALDGSLIDPYGQFIALSRYARYLDDKNRRETWVESVDRYMDFMVAHLKRKHGYVPDPVLVDEIAYAIKNLEIMPSMRALMTAGPALDISNVAGYNCSYLPIDDLAAFSEILFILMNGTGVGYSVERYYVDQLPPVAEARRGANVPNIIVGDSKLGWATAYRSLISYLWEYGVTPTYDLSQVRPAGSRLKTFGGRASGPEPLRELFEYTIELLNSARGRKLRPIEVHDLVCKIASVVVVGGVRRSAMIALSDLDDVEMATAKSGEWWTTHPHRALANISAVYHDKPSREDFNREWDTLVSSGSGERGIFNRASAQRQAARNGLRDITARYGTNPCGEIILKPMSFCNLTEVIVRPKDDLHLLRWKGRLATILGTWQSTLTDFPFLRPQWRRNAEEERLLGVSLTGIYDNPLTANTTDELGDELAILRTEARAANAIEAAKIGIPVSAAITCVKPSGTVSQLAGSASGIHPWHARYYIRRVRADIKDPLAQLMRDSGVPCEPDITAPDKTLVFSFPIAAPEGAVTRADLSAVEHLEHWLVYRRYWCEHNPSVTVSVRRDEWDKVREWVWEHLEDLTGVTFLPYADEDHVYEQAPYQEITEDTYRALRAEFPEVRWEDLPFYEMEDCTQGVQELACSAGACDVADLTSAA